MASVNPVVLRRRIFNVFILFVILAAIGVGVALAVLLTRDNGNSYNSNDTTSDRPRPQTTDTVTTTTRSTVSESPLSESSSGTSSSSSSSSSDPVFSGDLTQFEQEILDEHNRRRQVHSAQNLTWDPELVQFAIDYASDAFDCNNVQLIHSEGPYGENLAAGYVGGRDPVTAWYDEIEIYDFDNPGYDRETGHFTQLVWRATSRLGCAMITCDNSWRQYTICEYSESRGNIIGTNSSSGNSYFVDNVLPPVT